MACLNAIKSNEIITSLDRECTSVKTKISRKSSEVSEAVVTELFIKNFEEECKILGSGRLPNMAIEKTRTSAGEVFFGIKLKDSVRNDITVNRVLSEGEFRITSLAAFLADVNFKNDKSPFIFDDPISSLDEGFEESVASRLLDLSNERQVIVFTHRFTLLSSLLEGDNAIELIRNRMGCGISTNESLKLSGSKVKKRFNNIKNEVQRNKLLFESDYSQYERLAISNCTEFRKTLESTVEYVLTNGIVRRYDKQIRTDGMLHGLVKIKKEDCDLIQSLMTRYSFYLHD